MSERPFYLGKNRPMTWMRTWDEVGAASAGGLLAEHQRVELKKQLAPSSRRTNVELAKDLASLSVDGGLLIFGVEDKTHQVTGCPVSDLATRISQVAASTIKPPLSPLIHDPIESPDDPDLAVLIVEVPQSAEAPHMVDDRYWGRSADGKRPLSDPEVRRLLEQRAAGKQGFHQRLVHLVELDPLAQVVKGHPTGQGHLYFRAEPMAQHITVPVGLDPRPTFAKVPHALGTQWPSHLGTVSYNAFDPDGIAYATYTGVERTPVPPRHERTLTYASIKEDGTLVVVDGGATVTWERESGLWLDDVLSSRVALLALQSLEALGSLTLDDFGYTGEWRVGVHITELQGKSSARSGYQLGRVDVPFANPTYTREIITSPATWDDQGLGAADLLLRGFFRGLGMGAWDYETVLANG